MNKKDSGVSRSRSCLVKSLVVAALLLFAYAPIIQEWAMAWNGDRYSMSLWAFSERHMEQFGSYPSEELVRRKFPKLGFMSEFGGSLSEAGLGFRVGYSFVSHDIFRSAIFVARWWDSETKVWKQQIHD